MILALLSLLPAAAAILDPNCTYFDVTDLKQKFHPTAYSCENKVSLKVCQNLFDREQKGGVDPKSTERPSGCHLTAGVHNDDIRTAAASQCPKYCGYCCLTAEHDCENARYPRIDCDTISQQDCSNPMLKSILLQDCPKRCGFCLQGGCYDQDSQCRRNPTVCVTQGMEAYVQANCRLTCGLCSKN